MRGAKFFPKIKGYPPPWGCRYFMTGPLSADILRKPNSIIPFTIHAATKTIKLAEAFVKENNFSKFPTLLPSQFMRNTAKEKTQAPTRDTVFSYQSCPHADTRFIMSTPKYGKLSVGFQQIRIRENSRMNNNRKYLTILTTWILKLLPFLFWIR